MNQELEDKPVIEFNKDEQRARYSRAHADPTFRKCADGSDLRECTYGSNLGNAHADLTFQGGTCGMRICPFGKAHADQTFLKCAGGSDLSEMRRRIRPFGNVHADPTFRKSTRRSDL